jgi:hypothetical protein
MDDYYKWTPLDFISRKEWSSSLIWGYCTQILDIIGARIVFKSDQVKPRRDITDKFLFVTQTWLDVIGGAVALAFFGMYIIPWNFSYPTQTERLIWRIVSIYFTGNGFVSFFWLLYWLLKGINKELTPPQPIPDPEKAGRWLTTKRKTRAAIHKFADGLRNTTKDKDPYMTVPLRFIMPLMGLAAAYSICRAYILVEAVLQLRSLPPDAYQTVDWSIYVPHL